MHKIENDHLTVQIAEQGAEMKRMFYKKQNLDVLWPGKEGVWPRSSPVLFPVVGRLRNNRYTYKGKEYEMPQHGFARDMDFVLLDKSREHATFRLESNYQTMERFPFHFHLDITYRLDRACLSITYHVHNPGREAMYFSIGAHPGFLCASPEKPTDNKAIIGLDMGRELLVYRLEGGLVQKEPTEGVLTSLEGILGLTDEMIENDAMIFKKPMGRWVDLRVDGRREVLRLTAKDWPFFGIWSKSGQPFVCLEPWYGIADSVDHTGDLEQKEGILKLKGGDDWTASWSVEVR